MLLAPLALLLAVLAVPIILMYVLKLRRQEYRVPSTLLWRQALEDIQANAPWQRLRFNILLLLQLLALAAAIVALARPAYSRSHVLAGDLVLIVDQSYGMQAHDVAPSRFAAAQDRARTIASLRAGGNVVSVIGMGAHPHLAIANSDDGGAIRDAIDSLRVGVDRPDFLEALSLASSLARPGESMRVQVLTSRDSGITDLPLHVTFGVDIVRFGGRLHDLGITAFGASQRAGAVGAVARVSNFGSAPVHADLELLVDGRTSDVRPLTVAGDSQQNVFWNALPADAGHLEVRLQHTDDVSADKSAWTVVPRAATHRVLLVSSGDFFLQAALLDDSSVRLTSITPADYISGIERSFDLTVFDGVAPARLPAGSAFFVAPAAGHIGPIRVGKTLIAGTVSEAQGGSVPAILKYVDLSDVHVARMRNLALPSWMQPVVLSAGHPLLAAGEQGSARYAVMALDLQRSDWPLRISFPILVQNLVGYLAPGLTLGANAITTGSTVAFFPPPGTREIRVKRPDGAVDTVRPPFPPFTDTSHSGLYTVEAVRTGSSNATGAFAVNFFPARPPAAAGPATVHLGHVQAGKTLTTSGPVDIAWVFVVLALGILGLEWYVAFRGIR